MQMSGRRKVKQVAPDGGWGWLVVLGCSLINLFTRSIEPSFGLLFGDLLRDIGVGTTGAAIIASTQDAVVNFSGFLVGPLIKKYSYRKTAFLGGMIASTAFLSTSSARSMTHILITYSVIGGLGFGLATASTFVALNSYFVRRRGQAVGLAMAGTALGFMAMPQVISRLIVAFAFPSTMRLLGAASLNSLVGASLLQPIKWHMRPVPVTVEGQTLLDKPTELVLQKTDGSKDKEEEQNDEVCSSTLKLPQQTKAPSLLALNRQNSQTARSNGMPRNSSNASFLGPRRRKTSTISNVSCIDLSGSTMHIHVLHETDSDCEDRDHHQIHKNGQKTNIETGLLKSNNNIALPNEKELNKTKKSKKGCWQRFCDLMDFDLLLDWKYLNILFGLSITYTAEMNFKLMVPFFMANLGYSKSEIAQALSVMAIADITARIIMPPINDKLGYSRRKTLILGLALVAIARSILAEQKTWPRLMVTLVVHGFFRGFTLINFPLVLSESVVPEKFPAAFGLSMVSKGIFIVALGPFAGWIRDYTGSYSICLHAQSVMMLCCIVAWLTEFVITSRRTPKETIETCQPP